MTILGLIPRVVHGAKPPMYPQSFAYLLQADAAHSSRIQAVNALIASGRQLLVLDRSYAPAPGGDWTRTELERIRGGMPGRRIIAYLSVGEAERYRDYWRADWRIGQPGFVLDENPDWAGNFTVEYWQPQWQRIVLAEVDGLIDQGFDGVYMDIVDAFSRFERGDDGRYLDNRINPQTAQSYRQDMADLVYSLAIHARKRQAGFWVVSQNGAQLLAFEAYLRTVDAVAIEDLYTLGDVPQPAEHFDYVNEYLDRLRNIGKPVLLVEYAESGALRARAVKAAAERHDLLLLTDRALKTLGRSYAPIAMALSSQPR